METDIPYLLGKYIGAPLFWALVAFIIFRLVKKRNPAGKEWLIIVGVAVAALILLIGMAGMRAASRL